MVKYENSCVKLSGNFIDVSTEIGTIITCFISQKYPDFVIRTLDRSIIASLSAGMFTDDEMRMLLKDEHFNAGINESIKTIEALRELAQTILTSKQKG